MVAAQLLEVNVHEGRELLERLDAAGLPPVAAFWYFDETIERWRLALAYGEYDTGGPFAVYKKILPFAEPDSDLSLIHMTATGLRDGLVQQVRAHFAGHHVSPDRPRHTMVGGADVVVYRA